MPDRVLDERLQNHVRQECVQRFRIDGPIDLQSLLQKRLLYLQILAQEVEFLFKRDFLRLVVVQGEAQQVAQLRNSFGRRGRRDVDERGDRVQRVEEKVWVK